MARNKTKQTSAAHARFNSLLSAVQARDHARITRTIATAGTAKFSRVDGSGSGPAERTLLGLAVDTGCGKVVAALLTAKFVCSRVNTPEKEDGQTYLYVATKRGATAVVEALLTAPRIDVNKACLEWGRSPLHVAMANDDEDVAAALMAHPKINVNKASKYEPGPLHSALANGNMAIVAGLLAHPNLKVNARHTDGHTSLTAAVADGAWGSVATLLAHPGIDPNQASLDGCTPLHLAIARHDHTAATHLLAHPRLDPNATSCRSPDADRPQCWPGEQLTPLMVAVLSGFASLARALMAHTLTDINRASGHTMQTPLHVATCMLGLQREGLSPPASACAAALEEIFAGLLAHPGINVNSVDHKGTTPLMLATRLGFPACARALLMAGASRDLTFAMNNVPPRIHEATFAALFGSGADFYRRTRHAEVGYAWALRQAVRTVMLVMQRQDQAQKCVQGMCTLHGAVGRARSPAVYRTPSAAGRSVRLPRLPEELWLHTCTFLRSADFAVAC